MTYYVLPKPKQVADLVEMLVGRPTTEKKGKPQFLRPTAKVAVAAFKGFDSEDIVGACVFDIALAVNASAALSMIPASAVKGAIATGRMADNITENLAEVFNVACQLIHTNEGDFARLASHWESVKDVPEDIKKSIKGTKKNVHVGVDIEGYGPGLASFYLL